MGGMDDTTLDHALADLAAADPADAPEIAEALTDRLGSLLDDGPDADATPA